MSFDPLFVTYTKRPVGSTATPDGPDPAGNGDPGTGDKDPVAGSTLKEEIVPGPPLEKFVA
jgi:hypothetical protein